MMDDKKLTLAKLFEERVTGNNPGLPGETRKDAARLRWVRFWIGAGIALAVSLLVTSISTYLAVSRSVIVDQLRGDMHSEAALIEDRARQDGVQTSAQLLAVLNKSIEKSSGRVAWIRVQNREGGAIAAAGLSEPPTFSAEEIRIHFRGRQPLFGSIDLRGDPMLVETLPFILPAGPLQLAEIHPGDGPPDSIEIAEFLGGTNVALGAVRRHLFINSSAALLLLFALAIIGSRFRSYLRGKELEHQVEIARSVQRDLLPSAVFDLDEFDIADDYVPVAGVSGDFYDTFSIPGGRVGFVIGDVAGKGVPAAVLMGVLHGAVRSSNWMQSARHHCEATDDINRLLCLRTAANRFATMFWSYFDPQTQHLSFINAGHCPPLLVKRSQRNPVLRLSAGGPVMGLIPGAEFEQGSVPLEPGDRLIFYSDGVVEAIDASGEEFGEERLLSVVRAHSEKTAEALRDAILCAIAAFTGAAPQQDDRTLVVAVYLESELGQALETAGSRRLGHLQSRSLAC
jgi:hypothetical protein